jgi:hypothetical protein
LNAIDHAVNEGRFELADYLVRWATKHGIAIGDE